MGRRLGEWTEKSLQQEMEPRFLIPMRSGELLVFKLGRMRLRAPDLILTLLLHQALMETSYSYEGNSEGLSSGVHFIIGSPSNIVLEQ